MGGVALWSALGLLAWMRGVASEDLREPWWEKVLKLPIGALLGVCHVMQRVSEARQRR